MSKARDLADLSNSKTEIDNVNDIISSGALSHRNMLINPDFLVCQRSTSVSSVNTAGYKVADRWGTNLNNSGTWTISQKNDAPAGLSKSLKYTCDNADTTPNVLQHYQSIEGQNVTRLAYGTSSAKLATLSFWVKSNVVGTYSVRLYKTEGVARLHTTNYTISQADTWEFKTVTVQPDLVYGTANDASLGIGVAWWLCAGTNYDSGSPTSGWENYSAPNEAPSQVVVAAQVGNYWQIAGTQFELGPVTPFVARPIGEELSLCQRYYKDHPAQSMNYHAFRYSSSLSIAEVHFPVTMRVTPTYTQQGNGTVVSEVASVNGLTIVFNGLDGNIINTYTADAEL